jgi:hypothetical protein
VLRLALRGLDLFRATMKCFHAFVVGGFCSIFLGFVDAEGTDSSRHPAETMNGSGWHGYRNEELGIAIRYNGRSQPTLHEDNHGISILVPLTPRDYLFINRTVVLSNGLMDAPVDSIKKTVDEPDAWQLTEKSRFNGYPAWHLRFITKQKLEDMWLVAFDSTIFDIGCRYGNSSPGHPARELCKSVLSSIRFLEKPSVSLNE